MTFDLIVGLGLPLSLLPICMSLRHSQRIQQWFRISVDYISQGHRFDVYEDVGCKDSIYNTWVAVISIQLPPLLMGCASAVYTTRSIIGINKMRTQFKQLITTHSNMTYGIYFRLMLCAGTETLCVIPITSTYIIFSSLNVSPWISLEDTHSYLDHVRQFPAIIWRNWGSPAAPEIEMTRWLYVVCAIVLFCFFGITEEVWTFYVATFRYALNLIGIRRDRRSGANVFEPDSGPKTSHPGDNTLSGRFDAISTQTVSDAEMGRSWIILTFTLRSLISHIWPLSHVAYIGITEANTPRDAFSRHRHGLFVAVHCLLVFCRILLTIRLSDSYLVPAVYRPSFLTLSCFSPNQLRYCHSISCHRTPVLMLLPSMLLYRYSCCLDLTGCGLGPASTVLETVEWCSWTFWWSSPLFCSLVNDPRGLELLPAICCILLTCGCSLFYNAFILFMIQPFALVSLYFYHEDGSFICQRERGDWLDMRGFCLWFSYSVPILLELLFRAGFFESEPSFSSIFKESEWLPNHNPSATGTYTEKLTRMQIFMFRQNDFNLLLFSGFRQPYNRKIRGTTLSIQYLHRFHRVSGRQNPTKKQPTHLDRVWKQYLSSSHRLAFSWTGRLISRNVHKPFRHRRRR